MDKKYTFSIDLKYYEEKNKTIQSILRDRQGTSDNTLLDDIIEITNDYILVINGKEFNLRDIKDKTLESVVDELFNNHKKRSSSRLNTSSDFNPLDHTYIRLNFKKIFRPRESKKRSHDEIGKYSSANYDPASSVSKRGRNINFQFNNLSAFIQFVLKQFVLDKLHMYMLKCVYYVLLLLFFFVTFKYI